MTWLSIIPPFVAVAVVLWRREVILALFLAILSSELLLSLQGSAPFTPMAVFLSVDRITAVFASEGNTQVLTFSLLIGALLALLRYSGGVAAFVDLLISKGMTNNKRQAGLLSFGVGIVLFIESNLSILTAGILSRGLFDRFAMSRERLAYIIDSTSAPVCILLMFNAWGAFVLGLLSAYDFENPLAIVIGSIPYNFYAWIALALVLYTIVTDRLHGPLAHFEAAAKQKHTPQETHSATRARYMIVPLTVLTAGIFGFMYVTGGGELTKGNGSLSILYATVTAITVIYLMLIGQQRHTHGSLVKVSFTGMSELLPLVCIVLLSIALGNSLKELGTGIFIAGIATDSLPAWLIVPMLFLCGALMSFSTGTSWGTFAILIPIGVPIIELMALPPAFVLSAILGGGIFGDHCSPISDTTAVSSIAAGCDILDHVKTQLPYALFGGGLTFIAYVVSSLLIL